MTRKDRFYELLATSLGAYRMLRRNMIGCDVPRLLERGRDVFKRYLLEPDEHSLAAASAKCRELHVRLHNENRASSPTPVMISKVIMGLGGPFPALDVARDTEARVRTRGMWFSAVANPRRSADPGGTRPGYGAVDGRRRGRRRPSSALRPPFVGRRSLHR